MPPIYAILDLTVHDEEKYRQYQEQVPALIERYGGRYLARGGEVIALGDWQPERVVIVEMPSREQFQAMLSSPEYQAIQSIREEATTSRVIAVEGCEEAFPEP